MSMRLQVLSGPMSGESFLFETHDTFLFGRSENAHCRITGDAAVSRNHFLLEANPPQMRIRDLGSTNGIWINDVKYGGKNGIKPPIAELGNGDVIRVGKTKIAVMIETELNIAATLSDTLLEDTPTKPEGAPDIPGYHILRQLGEGGMGIVYLAQSEATGEQVAIKVMLPQVAVNEQAKQYFGREIKLTRTLNHKHIIRFLDDGFVDGVFYLVLEFAEHGDLAGLVQDSGGKIPVKRFIPIMKQILSGLAHAHGKGLVHRDLKPENILIAAHEGKGLAKVSDFGFAKSFEQAGLSGFTATGDVGGTPAYMPAEQITQYKYVDAVSDVFSIAATFYFALTGTPPYNFEDHADPINAILDCDITPIEERCPDLPEPLAAFFRTALASEPGDRFADAGVMRKFLLNELQNY